MIVYKVVIQTGNELRSVSTVKHAVVYTMDQRVYCPRTQKGNMMLLFAFKTVNDAQVFIGDMMSGEGVFILECEAKAHEKQDWKISAYEHLMELAWDDKKSGVSTSPYPGTVFCEWIKPIRLVKVTRS